MPRLTPTRREVLAAMVGGWAANFLPGAITPALATWGDAKGSLWGLTDRPSKVLEVYFSGGLSPWDTFYVTEQGAQPAVPDWRGFGDDVSALSWLCEGSPNVSDEIRFFAEDELGQRVYWGPATRPLWDLMHRARMVTLRTSKALIHEVSAPFAISGFPLGHAKMSGLGSAIQHRWMDLAPSTVPYAYIITVNDRGIIPQARAAAVSAGLHPGYATPLLIHLNEGALLDELARDQNGITPEMDQLYEVYRQQYRQLLLWQGGGLPLSSNGWGAYEAAAAFLSAAPELEEIFGGDALVSPGANPCVSLSGEPLEIAPNYTQRALELAAFLLDRTPARYVLVTDYGLIRANNRRTYDTHGDVRYNHVEVTFGNLFNALYHLRRLIDPTPLGPGALQPLPEAVDLDDIAIGPGAGDPPRIRLGNTVIRLFTEFGRTPDRRFNADGGGDGREHHGHWAEVLLGGQIGGGTIVGGLDADGATTEETGFGPMDMLGALQVAAHIWPFEKELFANGAFSPGLIDQGNETATAQRLRDVILGAG